MDLYEKNPKEFERRVRLIFNKRSADNIMNLIRIMERTECEFTEEEQRQFDELDKRGDEMKITEFAKKVCELEGKKQSISIAQVMEVLKIINKIFGGRFYDVIRSM